MPSSVHDLADSYRWYLCVQDEPNKWTCVKTTSEIALETIGLTPSTAIPIWKGIPKLLDPLLLHIQVHPRMKIR